MQTLEQLHASYRELTQALIAKHLTITTMESCTSGFIASLITDTEGSSQVFKGADITYSNEAKIRAGVPEETIKKFGIYSEDTAIEMAKAARKNHSADIGIGITGTMGNTDPANSDSVPGIVYFSIDFKGIISNYRIEVPPQPSRFDYKLYVAHQIIQSFLYQVRS